jgi:prepilin-type N-terminal cleavage/methylation domain-containing protein
MKARRGFTIMELLVVMVIGAIMTAVVAPSLSRSLAQSRLQRAAAAVSADLQLAHTLAARQRAPVRITVDAANRVLRVRDAVTTTTIFSERYLDSSSDFGLDSFTANNTNVVVYPNGLASARLELTLRAAARTRVVTMSPAGQVRVTAP